MAPLPLASGSSGVQAQQWRCAVRHTPPRLSASGSPGSSSTSVVPQMTAGSTSMPSAVPFGMVPGAANMRLVPSVSTVGATIRGTSAPKAAAPAGAVLTQDQLERQQSRNSLKGGITPTGGATPHGGSTPHGGTPRCRSRPHTQESQSPSRPVGVHVLTSAAWRVASPRQIVESTASVVNVSTTAANSAATIVPRPRSVGERGGSLTSRRLESPQLSIAHLESPQASPAVSARGFPCLSGHPTNGIRISGEAEVAEAVRMRQRASAMPSVVQHSTSMPYHPGARSSSGSHSQPVVSAHERACRSPQTPPPPHLGIEVSGKMCYRDSVGAASSPAVSSTAEPGNWDSCSRSSGALLSGASRSTQPESWRQSPQVPGGLAPGASSVLNNSACNSYLGNSSVGSCPALNTPEGALNTSELAAAATSAGGPPTPSPEDVPPWRSDCYSAKQESGHQSPGLQEEATNDNADSNPGLLTDIGWTPSFHSLAVASPGASTSSPLPNVAPQADQNLRQNSAVALSAEEEAARAMVMDIEAEAARAINEKYSATEPVPKSFVMKWDGKDWVPITPPSAEKATGGFSEIDSDRAIEELRSSVSIEAAERRRLEVLHSKAAEHIADCERKIASLQGSLAEANSQRDDFQRQLKDKSEKHSELVKRFRRHQEANKRLEEDLSRAAELRKRLEMQAKQERLGKVAAEQMAKELQQKVQDFEKEVTAVAQSDLTDKMPIDLEDQLEKLRLQLEETVRTVQLRCGPGSASGDLSKAAAVAAAATRGLTGSRHLSPSTLLLLEAADGDTKPSPNLLGVGSWANSKESTALSTEEELPTTEEQLLGEWSSTSLQFCESQHDRGSGEVARLADVDEELDLPQSVMRLMGGSSAESLGGASIGSVHSGAPPSEIDEGDGTVVLPLRETSEEYGSTKLTASELSHIREVVASPRPQSDDGFLAYETARSVRTVSCSSSNQIALSLRDLSEIKALKKPPPPIRMLMEVCCLLFHIQPVKQADERNAKKHKLDYWEPARRYLLSDPFFLSKLRMYESDEISTTQRAKIRKYFQDPEFTAERVKNCSKAAHELYEWVTRLVQPEGGSVVIDVRRTPPVTAGSRLRDSPPCARTPPPTSASSNAARKSSIE